jgi:hypothetical protein
LELTAEKRVGLVRKKTGPGANMTVNEIPGDAEIRAALRGRLRARHAGDPSTVILEELGICRGQARLDLAVVNGLLHGYEIKSDRDGLRRLGSQIDFYGRVVDQATAVVGAVHLERVLEALPPWWGVTLVTGNLRFKCVRRARKNPARDARSLVEFLWLEEALSLLARRNVARGAPSKTRKVVWDRICEHFGLEEVATAVRAHLKVRASQPDHPELSGCGA